MTVEDDINSGDKSNPKTVIGSLSDLNMSFGDPLYLHPNDTSGTPIITIKLTRTENYKMWSIAMTFALRNKNKLGFIDGSCKKDPSNPGLANQWDMCNSVVVTWILNSLSPELFAGAIYTKTASEIWNELKETYDKVDGSIVFNLHKNINSLNQNGSTLADYYNKLNSLWKQFDAMVGLPTCTCSAAKHFDQHNQLIKLMQFLMGLDESYLAIRSNLRTRESFPSFKTAFSVISGEESHRNVTSAVTTKPAATAFAAKSFDNKKKFNNNYKGSGSNSNFNSNNNNIGPNPNLKCTNCNKTRHTVDICFDLIGYPAGYVKRNSNSNSRPVTSNNASADVHSNGVSSNNATTGNSPVSLSSDQLARLMNLLNENGVSTANANMADVIVGNISLGWIVDSRANQHMTASANFLTNVVDVSNLGLTVGHPNGTQALITKIGDLKINNEVTLYDVLVVPEYTVSLLSVHKLSIDNKLFVTFDESNCYIQELKANKNVGIGKQLNGLYLFDVNNACKIVSNNCIANCFTSKTLLHQRLGHPADQVLDVLKTTLKLDSHSKSDHLCDTCNKAKQTREPFLLSNHKTTKIGELVHLDVCENPKRPNDEGRVSSNDDGPELIPDINQGNDDSGATFIDETNNTHPEGTVSDETDFTNDFYENSEFNSKTEELPVHTLRRSSRQTKLPSSLNDFIVERKVKYRVERVVDYANLNHDNYCFIYALNKSVEPTCYEEAILDSNWVDAINAEIEALNENHTWEITDLPPNRKEGIDFDETFYRVVKMSTVRCVVALSVTNNWPLFQLDVNNAFLYRDLDEDIYMTIPKGFANKDNKNKMPLLDNITGYQKLLGKLIYLTHTRPNIAYSVHCLAQYMHSPLKSHLNSALNVLRYLKGAPGKGIGYNYGECNNNLSGYGDADWAKCLKTRKSVIGYCVFFNNCLISWKSKKTEHYIQIIHRLEYRSLSSVACEIIWIHKFLLDLNTKVSLPIDLHCDNKYALQLAINPVFHERSKHFEID
ncbi:ribonuclease H-like domain-containing protein, partial [Tanacetum coccineum]